MLQISWYNLLGVNPLELSMQQLSTFLRGTCFFIYRALGRGIWDDMETNVLIILPLQGSMNLFVQSGLQNVVLFVDWLKTMIITKS